MLERLSLPKSWPVKSALLRSRPLRVQLGRSCVTPVFKHLLDGLHIAALRGFTLRGLTPGTWSGISDTVAVDLCQENCAVAGRRSAMAFTKAAAAAVVFLPHSPSAGPGLKPHSLSIAWISLTFSSGFGLGVRVRIRA